MRRAAASITIALTLVAPAIARDWTPHTAAALLDASFPTAAACQSALDDARRRESRARPVKGLSYTRLFEQGACRSFRHDHSDGWRIRMEWKQRATLFPKTAAEPAPPAP